MMAILAQCAAAVLVVVVLIAVNCARAELCPGFCFCFTNHDDNTLTVDCRNQDLYEIPYPLPNLTTHLDISNNLIQFIREADFWPGLGNLKFLQLQNNDLIDLQPGAFRRVPTLEVLNLYSNRIRQLRPGVFDGLINLQILDMHRNGLQSLQPGIFDPLQNIVTIDLSLNSITSISMLTFTGLQRLQRLSLSDNALTAIDELGVANLPSLTYLNLAYNELTKITPDAFFGLPRIRTVVLTANPLECGCCAVWLYNFFLAHRLSSPICETPLQFTGFMLLELEIQQFCKLPQADILAPDDVILLVGEFLQLDCMTSGVPPPDVTWSRNGMSLNSSDSRLSIVGSSLQLLDVSISDSGIYYCSAFSSAGRVASSVRVTVIDGQALNLTTISANSGDDVSFECVSDLPPGTPVQWIRNSIALVTSDQHSIDINGTLLIRNVGMADMGVYLCMVGDIVLVRMLDISASPVIVVFPEGPCEDPSRLRIDSDDFTQLNCSAFGIPPPTVRWLFMGMVLVEARPQEDLLGGATSVVYPLEPPVSSDAGGNYTCVASNLIETTEQTVEVRVRVLAQPMAAPLFSFALEAGATAVMECLLDDVDPSEIVSLAWRRMDALEFNERVQFAGINDSVIIIERVTPFEDTAQYMCGVILANNKILLVNYQLSVYEPPVITRDCPVPVVTAILGTNVSLVCEARGVPRLSWQWEVDGLPVQEVIPANRIMFNSDSPLLNIGFVQTSDSGLYNCTVSNDFQDQSFSSSYAIELRVQRLPDFAHQPQNTAATSGETVQLLCDGRGDPEPVLTWWKSFNETTFEEVKSDGRVLLSDESLVILNSMPSDEGTYFCRISSPLLTLDSNIAFLRIYTAPTIPPLPMEYIVLVGAINTTLDCRGTGDPLPDLAWVKDDLILPITGQHVQLASGSLVILEVTVEDAGLYWCRVANVGGEEYLSVNLIVRDFPETRIEPKTVTASAGCQVVFFCSDGGEVADEFKWNFQGDVLNPGPGIDILPSGQLILSNVRTDQSGNYTCSIWGPPGEASDTALLEVEGPSGRRPTVFSPTPLTQVIPLGQTAQFLCVADGLPTPEIIWLRNGSPQPNFRRVTIANGTLTIEDLRVTDEAMYQCVASNSLGEAVVSFTLSLASTADITVPPQSLTIVEGELIVLNCMADGFPEPTVAWFIDSVMVIPDGRRCVNGTTNTLTVFNTTTSDSGDYSCVATNIAGSTEYAIPVVVQQSMLAPEIVVPPKSTIAAVGMDIFLDCVAAGAPPPSITWLKDGELLLDCVEEMESNVCVNESVIITGAQPDNQGVYSCVAQNPLGISVYDVIVSVGTAPFPERMDLPFFNVFPRPAWIINGSSVTLECEAGGSPPPRISWLKDFTPLNLTDSTAIVLSNGSLFIPDAQEVDIGFYTCQADNGVGVNQVSVSVDVFSGSIAVGGTEPQEVPRLVKFPVATLTVLPGSSISLDCVAVGNPSPTISWFKDGSLINPFLNSISLALNGSLLLTRVSSNDSGQYLCLAENSVGSAQVHIDVDVLGGVARGDGGAPVFTVLPTDNTALSGSVVQLDCAAEGIPEPYIFWAQDHKPVYENEQLQVINGSLLFLEVNLSHGGYYQCIALSSQGENHVTVHLTVIPRKEPPYFTLAPPKEMSLQKKSHLLLPCHAESYDREITHIEWYYNGVKSPDLQLIGDGSLLFPNIRASNAGRYSCVASNKYGKSSMTTVVTVTRLPVDVNVSITVGSATEMACHTAEGNDINWKHNGRSINSFNHILRLPKVQLTDEGEYTCTSGATSVNYYLYVQEYPEIAGTLGTMSVRANHTVEFPCQATGKPPPNVSWYHGGHQLGRSSHHSVLTSGTLLMYRVTVQDSGMYMCVAENLLGAVESSTELVVKY